MIPKMVQRGGGVQDIQSKVLSPKNAKIQFYNNEDQNDFIVIDFLINSCESMGANLTNTILENISPYIQNLTNARPGFRILSNLCIHRRAYSEFKIELKKLAWKGVDGSVVGRKIMEGYRFA